MDIAIGSGFARPRQLASSNDNRVTRLLFPSDLQTRRSYKNMKAEYDYLRTSFHKRLKGTEMLNAMFLQQIKQTRCTERLRLRGLPNCE